MPVQIKSIDNTFLYRQYFITCQEELMVLGEYGTRMANHESTFVIQIDVCHPIYELNIDWRQKSEELVLAERKGRCQHYFVQEKGCIEKLAEVVENWSKQPNINRFEVLKLLKAAEILVHQWPGVDLVANLIGESTA